MAFAPAAYGQDKPQSEAPSESQKPETPTETPTKTDDSPDVLDELFEGAEDDIKKGNHCGPDPERKTTPIS